MKPIINLYKPVSLTPLQAIEAFKAEHHEYKKKKISYAGRLDPMAEGVLLLLVSEENKKINQYMKLDKEYRAQILFGFSTDTYDILGIPEQADKSGLINIALLKKTIKSFKGTHNQKLPAYSSYKIKGKSLFNLARNNNLPEKLPEKQVKIKNIRINSIYSINSNNLLKQIIRKISNLKGDFRQEIILKKWEELLKIKKQEKYLIADITISCSSGTYIRAIADELGKKLNTSAVLINLIRTKVENYNIINSVRFKSITPKFRKLC